MKQGSIENKKKGYVKNHYAELREVLPLLYKNKIPQLQEIGIVFNVSYKTIYRIALSLGLSKNKRLHAKAFNSKELKKYVYYGKFKIKCKGCMQYFYSSLKNQKYCQPTCKIKKIKPMERITIIGNLGQDARLSTVNGDETANFSVGVNHKFKDASGEQKETTTWYNCTIWKPSGVKNYLKKGQQVLIEGRPRVRIYENKQSEKIAQIDITVSNCELLGKAPETNGHSSNKNSATQNTGPDGSDPFSQIPDNASNGDVPF